MKFGMWEIDEVIDYLQKMKFAPTDRLDPHCVTRVYGELFVINGERKDDEVDTEWLLN